MTTEDRAQIISLVAKTVCDGAKQAKACDVVGVDERTLQRWQKPLTIVDGRRGPTNTPQNKFSVIERAKIIEIATSPEFADKSPHQIVPTLADRGEYLASESSFYRTMRAEDILTHRGKSRPKTNHRPKAFEVSQPNEVYSWDITYLLSVIRGQYFYLYMFLDVFSRKIVGWRVHDKESAEFSSLLLRDICKAEDIDEGQLAVHADNGGPMKGATMLATIQKLGIMPSFSRPSVSDDNPYSESLFKTLKYCPTFPTTPFESVLGATIWAETFVEWYNNEHLHSGIKFVTPVSRHNGDDIEILKQRQIVYAAAKNKNPSRWSKETRNWNRIETVNLNCLKKENEEAIATVDRAVS